MQTYLFLIVAALISLCSCRQDETANKSLHPTVELSNGSNIDVHVDIASELKNAITIVSASAEKPGTVNAVEAVILVRNETASDKRIVTTGKWSDASGNNYGGHGGELVLAPYQTERVTAGTQSKSVTTYSLFIATSIKTEKNYITDAVLNSSQTVAEGYGLAYSETASDEIIPALPIGGFANGEPFQGRTVVFVQDGRGHWRLEISDQLFDVLKGAGFARYEHKDLQTIYLDLPKEPAVGGKLGQKMSYGGGYFQIKTAPEADRTTSWNTSLAYAIEISDWNRGLSTAGPCATPDSGSASGKLYVSFKGSETGLANSWISGEFKDVPVLYCGVK